MKITFISLFPEYYKEFKSHSIIMNALSKNLIELETINLRDFSNNNQVDDTVYGGGPGMLLMIEPIVKAIKFSKTKDSHIVLVGPRGKTLNQNKVKSMINIKHLILICGHYEGIDSRIKYYIDEEISIGEYILTGGEIASMVIADSIIRLLPGIIKKESHQEESFENNGLLEYDQFTRPIEFDGHKVPKVLLNGNHKNIEKYRRQNSIDKTIEIEIEKKGN
ncbi:MAG: tRNA (guanosine(37)-N1)-methyltransferase TrmD [Mycoplasmataceae bacterium]|nr:tRNA (guanosine(37)-N1)-methyltransferase TrmD [Mycoplasmataceae bacterium]